MKKNVIVCGAGGFIGSHLVRRLKNDGCYGISFLYEYPYMR